MEEFKFILDEVKLTPLALACYLGRYDIVKLFMSNPSIDLNLASCGSAYTPLIVTCIAGQFEILELLLERASDIDINKQCRRGKTAFYYCFSRLSEQCNQFENHRICMRMAVLLLKHGANINEIIHEKKGYSILMLMCAIKRELSKKEKDNNYSMIKFLIEHGASKNMLSKKKRTLLDLC